MSSLWTSAPKPMSSHDNSSAIGRNVESRGQDLDSVPKNDKEKENITDSQDQETMGLHSRARAQAKEILYLREQVALASIRESQMLNEKYALERKFSELQIKALDEKQSEIITSASNELARRKGDLEVNLNLHNELKATEDERFIFTSSMLGVLAEYGVLPHVTNASSLTNSIKRLHDQLHLKIRTSHTRLSDLNSMIGNNSRNSRADKEIPGSASRGSQFSSSSMGIRGNTHYSNYNNDGKRLDQAHDSSRYVQENDSMEIKSLTRSVEMREFPNNENLLRTFPNIDRNASSHIMDNVLERDRYMPGPDQRGANHFSVPPMHENNAASFGREEDGPGIEGFQIIGDAKPGCNLLGCGYPVRGTSLCMFQWVRHYPDGTRQYIEGATNPNYVVTADDVDKLIAVECIPMDEQGRQGEIVRIFANEQNKITCDEDMQEEIDPYITKGQATFSILILLETSENWEPTILFLRRTGFQVKDERIQEVVTPEKYSKDLIIKIPSGLSTQFVLTCSNGLSYPFSTNNDIRMRDTLVLTMRIF